MGVLIKSHLNHLAVVTTDQKQEKCPVLKMAVNVYLGTWPSGKVETVKKDRGLHSKKIWRLSDAKKT